MGAVKYRLVKYYHYSSLLCSIDKCLTPDLATLVDCGPKARLNEIPYVLAKSYCTLGAS